MSAYTIPRVDLVLHNGRIWTGSEDDPSVPDEVEALAVRGGRIVAIGTDQELAGLMADSAKVIDLGGRRAIPGLIDSHIHAVRAGVSWDTSLHWDDVRTLGEGLAQLRERAAGLAPGEWISVVGGWHSRQLSERRAPTRAELDAVAPDNPVYIQELYDRGVLNSRALEACGWDDASVDPERGMLLRGDDGRLTGEVHGMGAFSVPLGLALAPDREQAVVATGHMLSEFATHGLTGVTDGGGLLMSPVDYRPIYELWRRGGMRVRVRMFMSAWTRGDEVENIRQLTSLVHPGVGDGLLEVAGVGEIPHLGCHDMEGFDPFTLSDASYRELVEIVRLCVASGWRMSIHAVLNSTLSRILDAWEQVQSETGQIVGRRFSVVHADEATEENIARIAALGAGIMVQNRLTLKASDYVEAWGETATAKAPPIALMRKHGVVIGGGTDATRANWFSPWASIGWMVTGESVDGARPRLEEHRMTPVQALAAYTRDAAWFTGEDDHRGRLIPGYDADLCVPTTDPLDCAVTEIGEIRSDLTVMGGTLTHASGAFADQE